MMKVRERHFHQACVAGLFLLPDRLVMFVAIIASMPDSAAI